VTRLRGPVALHAVLESSEATDFDLRARLSLVRADGSAQLVTEGRLRASHRALDDTRTERTPGGQVAIPWHSHERALPVPTDRPVALEVEIFPINLELSPGDRLRLGLSLKRQDAVVHPAEATLLPQTRVLLPALPT
jgi:predicted acyl esterase